jgi:hypothetical protein
MEKERKGRNEIEKENNCRMYVSFMCVSRRERKKKKSTTNVKLASVLRYVQVPLLSGYYTGTPYVLYFTVSYP